MTERMKDPRCLIDAEALASHVSIVSASESKPAEGATTKTRRRKGGESGRSGTDKPGMESSSSKAEESAAGTSKMSNTSMS